MPRAFLAPTPMAAARGGELVSGGGAAARPPWRRPAWAQSSSCSELVAASCWFASRPLAGLPWAF
eukprot:640158-Pyramimonas_sp.AAC.1